MTTIHTPSNGVKQFAQDYAHAGWRVLQVVKATKRPAQNGWPDNATWSVDQAGQLFTTDRYGIGVAMGRWEQTDSDGTYLVAIDCDCKPGQPNGVAAFAELIEQHVYEIGTPCIQHTPSGGVHYVWRLPFSVGNGKGALPDGVDVRGAGGQIVVQSSDTDTRHWEPGHAPWDHAPGIAPDWVQQLLQTTRPRDNTRGGELPPAQPSSPRDATKPGEIYNDQADWGSLLTRYGWRFIEQRTPTVSDWERPGQPVAGQTGGTLRTDDGNHGVFYVWSTTWANQYVPSHMRTGSNHQAALNPFAFFACVEHGGDMKAAASALGQQQRQRDDAWLDDMGARLGQPDNVPAELPANDGPQPGHTMRVSTLADYTGDLTPRMPTVLPVERSGNLLYADATSSIWGPSGSMKSWLAAFAVLTEVRKGCHALVIDYEMSQADWKRRLIALGVTAEQMRLVHYVAPREQLRVKAKSSELGYGSDAIEQMTLAQQVLVQELHTLADRHSITLAVIDGITELISSNGLSTNDAEDFALIMQAMQHPVADITGAAVLTVDHVTHQARKSGTKDSYPLGTQHKVSAITGAGFALHAHTNLTAFDAGAGVGQVDIHCVKDRHGQVGQGKTVATLWLRPQQGGRILATLLPYDPTLVPTPPGADEQDTAKVLASVRKLNDARKTSPDIGKVSTRKIANDVQVDPERVKRLLTELAGQGLVHDAGHTRANDWVPTASDNF